MRSPLRIVVVLPAVVIAVIVLVSTWPMLTWPYPRWAQTSAQWHQQFMWTGALAGTTACYYAFRLNAADRMWTQPRAPRLGIRVVLAHLALLMAWLLGAYVLALLPLTVRGGIGSPALLVMLSGVLAMAAAIAIGYVLGTLVPSAVIMPITALLLYASFVISGIYGDVVGPVSPVLYAEPQMGQTESAQLVAFRLAFFALITIASVSLAARTMRRRGNGNRGVVVDIAAHVAAPVALIAIALSNAPIVFTVDQSPPRVCRDVRGVNYCVHEAIAPQLPDMISTVDTVFARYGAPPPFVRRVWDEALLIDGDSRVPETEGTIAVRLTGDGRIVPAGLPEAILGIYLCPAEATNTEAMVNLLVDLTDYLKDGTPPSRSLTGMSEKQIQDWLRVHGEKLRACTLKPTDIPRA
ncbi:hypothetical protein LWC34_46815 [Kibdelosporangium philippinense]|uniref:Uncharacterized protein n=1 Tax=Kibdelosporangium philippinense TaxID=211113 RepID=A0ABS8ZRQ3_9PSEU|nr:hypothetical protein [Kibdelosporangium philippinense]MCE7010269.1 hypothetical protein [Kibdelosporangium philippinense]